MDQASFLNIPVSTHLNIFRVLSSIKGIGPTKAKDICKFVGVLPGTLFQDITYGQRKRIENFVQDQKDFLFESSLKRKVLADVRKLVKIKHQRGLRLSNGLPVRGQRTKTNAKTSRRIRMIQNLSGCWLSGRKCQS